MSDSDSKKIVGAGDLHGVAFDHMTLASAERVLGNKTANLSSASAASRLSGATTPISNGASQGQPSASSTPLTPATVRPNEKK
jgi:hypothetical protein